MSDPQDNVLEVESLRFSYGNKTIVDLEKCTLGANQSMAVIGPSGCGKTTFLHLVAGLLTPDSGSVRILSQDIGAMDATHLDRFRGQSVGMVFQRLFLMPALTVFENVRLAQQMARKPRDDDRVTALLNQLDLSEVAEQKPRTLSQGKLNASRLPVHWYTTRHLF